MNTNVTSALTFYLLRPNYEYFSLLCASTRTINNTENTSVSSNPLKCQLTILHSALDTRIPWHSFQNTLHGWGRLQMLPGSTIDARPGCRCRCRCSCRCQKRKRIRSLHLATAARMPQINHNPLAACLPAGRIHNLQQATTQLCSAVGPCSLTTAAATTIIAAASATHRKINHS